MSENQVCIKLFYEVVDMLEVTATDVLNNIKQPYNIYGLFKTISPAGLGVNTPLGTIWLYVKGDIIEATLPPSLIDHYPQIWDRKLMVKTINGSLVADIYNLKDKSSSPEEDSSSRDNVSIMVSIAFVIGVGVGYFVTTYLAL